MTKHLLWIALLSILAACTSPEVSNLAKETDTKPIESDLVEYKLDSLFNVGIFTGMSVAIVDEDGPIYQAGYGFADAAIQRPYTETTTSNIASISKVTIGLALLKAQEDGLLNIDDPINRHLPFQVVHPLFPDKEITLRNLATHTSAILDGEIYLQNDYVRENEMPLDPRLTERYDFYYQNPADKWIDLKSFLFENLNVEGKWYADSTFAKWAPGAKHKYSNLGAALCALAIETASGQDFAAYTKAHIFDPLGIKSTTWFYKEADKSNHSKLYCDGIEIPPYTILSYPDGGLITSADELGKMLSELIRGYQGKGRILNASSYAMLFEPQLNQEQLDGREGFNAGLFLEMHVPYHVIGHSGGDPGVNTMMYFNSETLQGRLMLTNSDSDKENSSDVFWGIWDALELPLDSTTNN